MCEGKASNRPPAVDGPSFQPERAGPFDTSTVSDNTASYHRDLKAAKLCNAYAVLRFVLKLNSGTRGRGWKTEAAVASFGVEFFKALGTWTAEEQNKILVKEKVSFKKENVILKPDNVQQDKKKKVKAQQSIWIGKI